MPITTYTYIFATQDSFCLIASHKVLEWGTVFILRVVLLHKHEFEGNNKHEYNHCSCFGTMTICQD